MTRATAQLVAYYYFICSDETVEVGAPLYEIDTDATATVTSESSTKSESSSKAAESPKEEAPQPAQEPVAAAQSSGSKSHRTPSIQFLGKEGWAARLKGDTSPTEQVVDLPPIHPMYGRPAFSEEEMEAFMLGGAEQAPKVVSHSSGAVFTY